MVAVCDFGRKSHLFSSEMCEGLVVSDVKEPNKGLKKKHIPLWRCCPRNVLIQCANSLGHWSPYPLCFLGSKIIEVIV